MVKNAMMICISCKKWNCPKHILFETDGKDGERLDDIANRAFEKYKDNHNIDNLVMIDYCYYGNVEVITNM